MKPRQPARIHSLSQRKSRPTASAALMRSEEFSREGNANRNQYKRWKKHNTIHSTGHGRTESLPQCMSTNPCLRRVRSVAFRGRFPQIVDTAKHGKHQYHRHPPEDKSECGLRRKCGSHTQSGSCGRYAEGAAEKCSCCFRGFDHFRSDLGAYLAKRRLCVPNRQYFFDVAAIKLRVGYWSFLYTPFSGFAYNYTHKIIYEKNY